MEDNVGDTLQCEEKLRTTLHCDDKDKLRRRLALLQKEYLRTAQKLQRAERLEAVRSHVRTRITQKNDRDQSEPEVMSNVVFKPSSSTSVRSSRSKAVQNQQHIGGPVDSSESRRRSFLPSDSVCTSTPVLNLDSVKGPRVSPALRLRSRRSRMRWEKRSTKTGWSTDNSEEGQEQSEKTEGKESHPVKYNETEVVHESEELISPSESESPSLLLTHWNPQEQSESVENVGNQEQRGKHIVCTGRDCSESQKTKKETQGREDGDNGTFYDETMKSTKQRETEPAHVDIEGEKTTTEGDGKRLLDSCTLVEGLLFPAEYYVRTTRRMAVSQSHPDMQAVILSQLSVGRHRRSWGRGRRTNKPSPTNEQRNTPSDFSSTENETDSVGFHVPSHTCNSQSSSETSHPVCVSQTNADVLLCTPRPSRGRRRRGGRGRGRSRNRPTFQPTHQQGFGQTSADTHPVSTSATSCLSLPDQTKPHVTAEEDGPVSNNPQPVITHSTVTQHASVGTVAQSSSALGDEKRICSTSPKSNDRSNNATCIDSGADWCSLLLPTSQTPQTSPLLPLPSLTSHPLVKHLVSFDTVQDFHLPDDQFASLKLHKLRQVALASGVEYFTPPSHNTRSNSNNRYSDLLTPLTPLPLSLSLTPTVEDKQTFTQAADRQNTSSQSHESENKTRKKSESIHTDGESQSSSVDSVPVVVDSAAESLDQMNVSGRSGVAPSSLRVHQSMSETYTNQETQNEAAFKTPFRSQYVSNVCTDTEVSEATLVLNVNISVRKSTEPSDPMLDNTDKCLPQYSVCSQILLSPSHATGPSCPHPSSPGLPSLGLTPHPVPSLTCSPPVPSLTLPPPHSPSTQDLSPPDLSPLPPSLCPTPPSAQSQPPPAAVHCQRVGPDTGPTLDQTDLSLEKQSENQQISGTQGSRSCTHMLKAPAGGSLVDVCSFLVSSGSLCVAAAGKWAVCVWTQISASDWNLTHTWTFNEPVISVFPVPDATGLICVTLGQLEIRQVRLMSCSSFTQVLLCDGIIQTVVGIPESRVVTSSHSASTSTLQVFKLSDSSLSTWTSQPLVSPGVSIGALAAVDGLSDALIGTDECGHLFIWNLQTGHLLQKIPLGEGLSHSACLRGYSTSGVLFVLMQHHFLSSLEEEEKEAAVKYQMFPENEKEEKKFALFSLVAVNPRCGKSVLATRLYPPKSWTGRLCEADVRGCNVVGVSPSGCGCVWDLRRGRGGLLTQWAPESEGWQLARWGPGNVLLTGHHNGDVTLHDYSHNPTEP